MKNDVILKGGLFMRKKIIPKKGIDSPKSL